MADRRRIRNNSLHSSYSSHALSRTSRQPVLPSLPNEIIVKILGYVWFNGPMILELLLVSGREEWRRDVRRLVLMKTSRVGACSLLTYFSGVREVWGTSPLVASEEDLGAVATRLEGPVFHVYVRDLEIERVVMVPDLFLYTMTIALARALQYRDQTDLLIEYYGTEYANGGLWYRNGRLAIDIPFVVGSTTIFLKLFHELLVVLQPHTVAFSLHGGVVGEISDDHPYYNPDSCLSRIIPILSLPEDSSNSSQEPPMARIHRVSLKTPMHASGGLDFSHNDKLPVPFRLSGKGIRKYERSIPTFVFQSRQWDSQGIVQVFSSKNWQYVSDAFTSSVHTRICLDPTAPLHRDTMYWSTEFSGRFRTSLNTNFHSRLQILALPMIPQDAISAINALPSLREIWVGASWHTPGSARPTPKCLKDYHIDLQLLNERRSHVRIHLLG